MDQSKKLKFEDGSKTEVTIFSMGMEEDDFGSKYVVHVKETIDGYDYFHASDGLQRKMSEANVGEGDKIIIEKVAPSEKYKYGYFNIEMAENRPVTADPVITESPVGTGFAQKDDKMNLHELTLRIEALEAEILKLKKDALLF